MKFWYREEDEYYPETFQVGYSTTDNDPDSFTWGDEITATTSYQQFKANYPADTKYVAVKHTSDNQWNLYLDDFLFEESPSCIEPTGVQVADVTTNSATISWTAGGSETAWDIYVTADATIVPDDNTTPTVANANNNSYSLSNLSAGTIYYVYVRAICSGTEVSDWSLPATFATICNPIALPWIENFNNFAGPGMPVCWNSIFEGSDFCGIQQFSENNSSLMIFIDPSSGPNSSATAVLPEIDENYPLNGYQISFDAGKLYSYTHEKLDIGIMTDPADPTTFTLVEEVDIIDIVFNGGFGTYTVYFNNYTGNGHYIAIRGNNINSEGFNVLIDNIVVSEAPSCISPTGLAADAASTSAELSWTANNSEASWTLYWKERGAEAYTEVPNVTANPYTLSNLNAATAYQFYVVAHRDENDHSAPSALYTFTTTDCDPITLPWSEDFNDLVGEDLPACWNTIIDGSSSCSIAPFSGDDNNGLVISINGSSFQNSAAVVLPEVDASYPLNQCQISFDAGFWCENSSTTEEQLIVSIMSDPNDSQTAEMIGFVAITDAYPHIGRHTVRFNDYEGNGQYIALVCLGGGGPFGGGDPYAVFIDNIEVSPLPSCIPPANLIASNITGSSAQLAWTANGQSAWDIYVTNDATDVPDDDTTPTVANTEDNPYSLTELNSLTTYYVYVRAICGENEVSEWSNRASFTTKCATTTVDADNPYTQDFNDETFPPDCWELGGDPISNWYQTVQGYAYTEYNPTYLYMPFLHIDADNAVLTFKTMEDDIESYTGGSEGEDGLSIVKVSTDGGGTWTQLWCPTINELTTDFRTVTLSLYDYVGQDILIAFEHQGPHSWTIDDVEVKAEQLATFTKTIEGYGEGNGGWYLIASPVLSVTPTADNGFITDNFGGDIPEGGSASYDLYYFDQTGGTNGKEWKNYRAHHNDATYPFNALVNGKGYLYASQSGTELTFAGTLYSGNGEVTLTYEEGHRLSGWNLIGNPFSTTATLDMPFYRMNTEGSALSVQVAENSTVDAMEGVFVQATAIGQTATFTQPQTGSKGGEKNTVPMLNVNLSRNRGDAIANAIVRFDGGQTLGKLSLHEDDTKLYIPQNGKGYAIVTSEGQGELPLNLKAKENGNYTITVNPEHVEMAYLHLIDNLTGADIDLLHPNTLIAGEDPQSPAPSYTFTAKTTDYASRFKLVFVCGDADGDNDAFAFYSNGNWVISNEGEATLQVMDVNGRVLSSETINGSVGKAIHGAAGVYVIRLINGENVKVQKIVVK